MSTNPAGTSGGAGPGATASRSTAANTQANATANAFDLALDNFKKTLKKKEKDDFKATTFEELTKSIADIQKKQLTQRQSRNMTRLKRFLEAMDEYGKVIEIFCNSSQFVPFIWGPMKFLLQVTSAFSEAFSELLDVYERMGENIPLLLQYQTLFQKDHRIGEILVLMYKDILEFHQQALSYFQQPMWKKLFDATWKTFKTRFSNIIENMSQHRLLIERQVNLSEIEDARTARVETEANFVTVIEEARDARGETDANFKTVLEEAQRAREVRDAQFHAIIEGQEQLRRQAVYNWLRATSAESDQDHCSGVRAEYPQTGKWLLAQENFKLWFDPQFPSIPPLLWLNGKPGAGKTILTSLVVQEVQLLSPRPTVLFFYCKSGDIQRDNFVSIARSLLSQLLSQNKDLLLPYFYEQAAGSAEAVLTSQATAKALLETTIGNCKSVYIILDGLDECSRDERKTITSWFRKLVEDLPPSNADGIRCLFVSQDDGIARKDFAGLSTVTVRSQDNKADIEEYSTVWVKRIKDKFEISDDLSNYIVTTTVSTAEGMFLLARLICDNLLQQTSIEDLEDELAPNNFPKEINQAYSRIIARLFKEASPAEKTATLMLLAWLVCAKRPLKWHEIQGAKAIDLDRQSVEWDRRRFRVSPKDLGGSLVEVRRDQTVELVHLTAKFFLVDEKYVIIPVEEIKLACLCVDYMTLPSFSVQNIDNNRDIDELIFRGYYAFMDYAIIFWIRHLEAGIVGIEEDESAAPEHEQMVVLLESLETFLDTRWAFPTTSLQVSQKNKDRLRRFKNEVFYDTLEQAVVSTRKQLKFYGKMKKEETALDLGVILQKIRNALEAILSRPMEDSAHGKILEMYGTDLYKCSRFSCNYFSNGFSSSEQRDQHMDKHDRPFRCTVEGCPTVVLGLATAKDLAKHMRESHGTIADQEQEFPVENELAPPKPVERPSRQPALAKRKPEKKVFSCNSCSKVFTRSYNLKSHLATHATERPYSCSTCPKTFVRQNDCKRHEISHSGEKFICKGVLRDGSSWGCGKEFTRADSLGSHHKSSIGQQCILPSLQDKELEQGNIAAGVPIP